MATVQTCYTSAACNKCPYSADWGRNGLICYAFNHGIAIYKPQVSLATSGQCCVTQTLVGHSGKVNCVKWVTGSREETEIVSGSTDKTAIVWRITGNEHVQIATLKGHQGPLTCVTGMNEPESTVDTACERKTLIATASTDSTVRIWSVLNSEAVEQQVISTGTGFALSLAFTISHLDVPILACGRDDQKIHLYAMADGKQFSHVISLSGHEDWIRCLDFAKDDNGDILLASCAQDQLIRVWRFKYKGTEYEDKMAHVSIADLPMNQDITMKETTFNLTCQDQTVCYAVSLDSVLCGHDNWVYSVRWQPRQATGDTTDQPLCLLSASMDKTMILWEPDAESGIWIEKVRVGDVGGNTLGFYGGLFSPCGQSILGHGYQGAFHQWTHNQSTGIWEPQVTVGGHFDSVEDLGWSRDGGHFLISTSKDQTTRLHAPWVSQDGSSVWCEIARPQVHGYDLQCLAVMEKYKIACGADEKIVRLFSAPRNFITNFCNICGHDVAKEISTNTDTNLPEGANVPALGLSNKAVFTGGSDTGDNEEVLKPGQYPENYFTAVTLSAPPTEDQLLQNTLWPEEGKLYGHGYEIFSLAAHPSGKLLASACKAARADVANILLWDMATKRSVGSLVGPTLTITQMAFSHNGRFLLAVSRDRTWALFKETENNSFEWHCGVDKKTTPHSRIIWACAWTHDDLFFFTASRDKKVFAWSIKAEESSPPSPVSSQTFDASVTSISTAPVLLKDDTYLVASGLENGNIVLHTWSCKENTWSLIRTLNQMEAHHLQINRLAFRPAIGRVGCQKEKQEDWLQLASCGADHAVKVYDINISAMSR